MKLPVVILPITYARDGSVVRWQRPLRHGRIEIEPVEILGIAVFQNPHHRRLRDHGPQPRVLDLWADPLPALWQIDRGGLTHRRSHSPAAAAPHTDSAAHTSPYTVSAGSRDSPSPANSSPAMA